MTPFQVSSLNELPFVKQVKADVPTPEQLNRFRQAIDQDALSICCLRRIIRALDADGHGQPRFRISLLVARLEVETMQEAVEGRRNEDANRDQEDHA